MMPLYGQIRKNNIEIYGVKLATQIPIFFSSAPRALSRTIATIWFVHRRWVYHPNLVSP